jgi:hypothetical protein
MVAGLIARRFAAVVESIGLAKTIIAIVFLIWGTVFVLARLIQFFYQCVLLKGGCDL